MATALVRVGHGVDVHAFAPGNGFMLAGIWVTSDAAVLGHSDGDVVFHALTDAFLGAVGAGDLGSMFGVDRPEYKNAPSETFLVEALARVRAKQLVAAQVDVTVLTQKPKLAPYREQMRQNLADSVGLNRDDVSVKFTSTDELGLIGRGEGIAAFAVVGLAARV